MPLAIFAISFFAAFLSSMSGAGSGMVTIPAWIFMGYSLPVALASNQLNGALWTPIAARNYLRGTQVDWPLAAGLTFFGLLGVYTGARVVFAVDPLLLQRVVGVVICSVALFAVARPRFGIDAAPPRAGRLLTSVLAFPLGFYEAFFGSGNGIFTSSMLAKTRGFELTTALGYFYLIAFTWCSFAASLFLARGHSDLSLIIPSALGAVSGAFLGSAIGSKKGSAFVKSLFIVLGALLGLKLALGV